VFWATSACLAAPTIKQISSPGLQTGATTVLVVEGTDLTDDTEVVLTVPVAAQKLPKPATADRVEIAITLDASVIPGIYPLRVVNRRGISNAVLVGIDQLAERPFAPDAGNLPVALGGTLTGGTILRTSFDGKAGQQIVADIESHRLGSSLNPVLHLFDARGEQLAWSQMVPTLNGDARIVARIPADGRYTVELHDALYRGAEPGAFRLKIGELHYADLLFPLGGQRGSKVSLAPIASNLAPEQRIDADLAGAVGTIAARWPTDRWLTGTRPQILVGDLPEVLEQEGVTKPQLVPAPVALDGRLLAPHEEDQYVLAVSPGQTWRLAVTAAQVGSPLDGVLSVRKESGEQLATADDTPTTTDPTLDFKVPDGVDRILVAVKDLLDRGGPDYVYRLTAALADRPDFRLQILADREQVPGGGAAIVRVRANRAGYQGPIKLSLLGLPSGIAIANDEIPAGATDALVSLLAFGSPAHAITSIVGTSADPNILLVRPAQLAETPMAVRQPWLRSELALAVTGANTLSVVWEPEATGTQLPLGSRLPARIAVTRAPLAAGAVRLSLVTSQIAPRKEITENNQKRQVDDVDRMLRLEGTPTIASDQAALTTPILVPADLPNIPYDMAIKAELLSADGKTTIASATTPARRLTSIQPLRIELAGEPKVEAKSGSGETGRLLGKVIRLGDLPHPVTVTLTGLPADFLAPAVEVPADKSDFSLPVSFPFNTPPNDLANVAIVATAQPGGGTAVRSNELPVAVKIVAGGAPPALYRLFEDEQHFVSLLNEGGGKATVEPTDRFAGTVALRVSPDQKFRAKLPGLGVKIAEKPGEGEYRYLRFAWKKIGGGNVLLQLNANGTWGPTRGQGKPGYRYEAGPADNSFHVEAIKISDRLPYGWTVVTRDLFADFGAFELDGLAFTAGDGEAALFDHIYLARNEDDFQACPAPLPAEQPLAVFEDQPDFVASMNQGDGSASLATDDKFTGAASVRVMPDQRYNPALPGLGVKIRQNPGAGEYRYLQFAWKKQGGQRVCLQLNHDGQWGPVPSTNPLKFRYDAGPGGGETFGGAKRVGDVLPSDWVVVTRDLFADFGEFTFSGLALCPVDGDFALFDHIYLARAPRDLDLTAQ
jgi:hypothetical protein